MAYKKKNNEFCRMVMFDIYDETDITKIHSYTKEEFDSGRTYRGLDDCYHNFQRKGYECERFFLGFTAIKDGASWKVLIEKGG